MKSNSSFLARIAALNTALMFTLSVNAMPARGALLPPINLPQDEANHPGAHFEWFYYNGTLSAFGAHSLREFNYFIAAFLIGPQTFVQISLIDRETGEKKNYALPGTYVLGSAFEITFDGGAGRMSHRNGNDQITVKTSEISLDLNLRSRRQTVLFGDQGIIDNHASEAAYMSRTRLDGNGSLELNGKTFYIAAASWFDHQWGMAKQAISLKWSWVGAKFDNGTDFMGYTIYDKSTGAPVKAFGALINKRGEVRNLSDVTFAPIAFATLDGAQTPTGWSVSLPEVRGSIVYHADVEDQRFAYPSPFGPYYEGGCRSAALFGAQATQGNCFMELVNF